MARIKWICPECGANNVSEFPGVDAAGDYPCHCRECSFSDVFCFIDEPENCEEQEEGS